MDPPSDCETVVPWQSEAVKITVFALAHLAAVVLLGLTACFRRPEVTVVNNSGVVITGVVISGSGFTHEVGDIRCGGSAKAAVRPTADSGLRLAFGANGRRHTPPQDGYLEASPHYRVTATVAPDFTVKVESNIKPEINTRVE